MANISADAPPELIDAINVFLRDDVGGILVTDDEYNVVYYDKKTDLPESVTEHIIKRCTGMSGDIKGRSWEFTDYECGRYYRIVSSSVNIGEKRCLCHYLTDVSDYANLFQDITDYSRKISDVSDFQANILSEISKPFEYCLPILAGFCHSKEAVLLLEDNAKKRVTRARFRDILTREPIELTEGVTEAFCANRFNSKYGFHCLLSESVGEYRYAVFLREGDEFDEEYFKDISVYNVIRLYIENGILREKIIYESEHDRLTDLYNKGKYMSMKEERFGNPKSLAVFNLDVNDLKYMNDHFGHDAGDHLIQKAANSIHAVTADNVYGFRMGGDEFAMIALNVTQAEAEDIRRRWREALEKLNSLDDRIECIISCGMAYGEGDYDPDFLMEQADVRMYKEKRKLKENMIRSAGVR